MTTRPFFDEAVRIGDQLIDMAKDNEYGISWPDITENSQPSWHQPENLYSGASGISLFFIELYGQTNDKTYLDAAEKSMAWVVWYCDHHPSDDYSLVAGSTGVAYTFLKLHQATGDQIHLQKALAIAKSCKKFIPVPKDYMNGTAGTLLGLLHLHAVSREPWLLEIINDYVQVLIKGARQGQTGLYWDRNYQQIHPLCGFSHGAAGIGFVFLELGRYFDNSAFYFIADQAFAYENTWFNPNTGNWPDFRLRMTGEPRVKELERQYERGDTDALITPFDKNTWCNGAAGIALARLRAYELTGNKSYLQDLMHAVAKVKQTGARSQAYAGLCHGSGGNADSLIESYRLLHDRRLLHQAERFGMTILQQKQQYGHYQDNIGGDLEDPSLFKGLAGIGYFFLRLHSQGKVPSVLAPKLTSTSIAPIPKSFPLLSLDKPTLRKSLIKNTFPRTIQQLENQNPRLLNKYLQQTTKEKSERTSFVQFAQDRLAKPSAKQQPFKDAFLLELLKVNLDNTTSSGLLYIKDRVKQKRVNQLLQLADNALLNQTLVLASECKLFTNSQNEYFLLKLTAFGVEERKISQFCFVVLHSFTKPCSIRYAVNNIAKLYAVQGKSGGSLIKAKVLDQLREALANNIVQV